MFGLYLTIFPGILAIENISCFKQYMLQNTSTNVKMISGKMMNAHLSFVVPSVRKKNTPEMTLRTSVPDEYMNDHTRCCPEQIIDIACKQQMAWDKTFVPTKFTPNLFFFTYYQMFVYSFLEKRLQKFRDI